MAAAGGAAWTLPWLAGCASGTPATLRLGVGADLHHDLVPDGAARLAALQSAAAEFGADALAQLGDFCHPIATNRPLLRQWREGPGPQIDVLGNHDMDGGFTSEATAHWLGMPARYHSFVLRGYRLIVLDGNERRPDLPSIKGYPRAVSDSQLAWLESTLAHDTLPVVVLCHQGLDGIGGGVANAAQVRAVLERAHQGHRIRLVLTGHHHLDYLRLVRGIPYLQVNSFSYHWTDRKTSGGRFSPEVEARYPYLKQVLVYDRPLFGLIELTPSGGRVIGRSACFVGGYGPREAGVPEVIEGHPVGASVSNQGWVGDR